MEPQISQMPQIAGDGTTDFTEFTEGTASLEEL